MLISFFNATAQNNHATNFDDDWTFHLGAAQGAEQAGFDDSKWRKIDLPHDWSIEDLKGTASPFNMRCHQPGKRGFTTGGTGWYRKTFTVAAQEKREKNTD